MKSLIKHNQTENFIQNLQEEMDRVMEDTFGSLSLFEAPKESKLWRPPLEIAEIDNEYRLKIQLPGFDKKDINVEIGADYISVKAQHSFEKGENKKNLHRSEFKYGNFMRTVSFPNNINPKRALVGYKNGVVIISVEKMEQKGKNPKAVVKKNTKAISEKLPKTTVKKSTAKKTPLKKMAKQP